MDNATAIIAGALIIGGAILLNHTNPPDEAPADEHYVAVSALQGLGVWVVDQNSGDVTLCQRTRDGHLCGLMPIATKSLKAAPGWEDFPTVASPTNATGLVPDHPKP